KNAYDYYIKKCGQDTKIQKIAFKAAKKSLTLEYLIETEYFKNKENNIEEIEILSEEIKNKKGMTLSEIYDSVSQKVKFYSGLFEMNFDETMMLRLEAGKEILLYKNLDEITEEILIEMVKSVVLRLNSKKQ
ncbi:hypothetical protein, partial [Cetobacterium sp. ZOR0034]